MTKDALQVATDILRELGMDDVARWVEHPEAVRELLKHDPVHGREQVDELCADATCGVQLWDFGPVGFAVHKRKCTVAAAWRALSDPRGAADVERAHEEAKEHNRVRGQPIDCEALRETSAAHRRGEFAPFHEVEEPFEVSRSRTHFAGGQPRESPCDCAACEAEVLRARRTSDARGLDFVEDDALNEDFMRGGRPARIGRPLRRHLAPEQVEQARRCTHRYGARLYAGQTRCDRCAARRASDARGMEAVEAEARGIHRMARVLPFNTQGEPILFVRK